MVIFENMRDKIRKGSQAVLRGILPDKVKGIIRNY